VGAKRVPRIEAELLFRGASDAYQKGPDRRYLLCRAICLAKKGKLKESIDLFSEAGDNFHSLLLSYPLERKRFLPKREPGETVFEATQLAGFWRGLSDPDAAEPSSTVL
jgi:hypothetical protein